MVRATSGSTRRMSGSRDTMTTRASARDVAIQPIAMSVVAVRQRRASAIDSSARAPTTSGAQGPQASAMRYATCAFCRSVALTRGIVTTGAIDPASGTPACSSVDVRAGTGIVRRTETRPWSSSFVSALHDGDELRVERPDARGPGGGHLRARDQRRGLRPDRRLERLLDRRLELDRTEDALDDAIGEGLLDLGLGH